MGLTGRRGHLTPDDLAWIKDNWGTLTVTEMGRRLGCSKAAISYAGQRLGLRPLKPNHNVTLHRPPPKTRRPFSEDFHTVRTSSFVAPPTLARLMAGR